MKNSELTLTQKLRILYATQETLPKLIDDNSIPVQRINDYYVDLLIQLKKENSSKSAAIRMDDIFTDVDNQKACNKVLITGGAGSGKSTLLDKMIYQWGREEIFGSKFNYVFKVKLKYLISDTSIGNDLANLIYNSLIDDIHAARTELSVQPNWITIDEIRDVLNDTNSKMLLMLDGYDEVASLGNGTSQRRILNKIFNDEQQSYIMTSRPGALDSTTLELFKRKIDCLGFDEKDVEKYINNYFAKQEGEGINERKEALLNIYNNQYNMGARDLLKIPINLLMACYVFSNGSINNSANSIWFDGQFSVVDLYNQFILQLGKRYLVRENNRVLSQIQDNEVWGLPILKVLKKIAYKNFRCDELLISGRKIDKIARDSGLGIHDKSQPALQEVDAFGLLSRHKREFDNNILDHNYEFVHPSFQEYFAAGYLKDKLMSDTCEHSSMVANYIAENRYDSNIFLMLKFLTGLVAREKGGNAQRLINRFWDALVCNVDGILEFGVNKKITLLMQLLNEAKISGIYMVPTPHLRQIRVLINDVVLKDLSGWGKTLRSTGYISNKILIKLYEIFHTDSSKVEELTLSIKLICNHIDKFEDKDVLLKRVEWLFLNHEDLMVKGAAMEVLAKISLLLNQQNILIIQYIKDEALLKGNVNLIAISGVCLIYLQRIGNEPVEMLFDLLNTASEPIKQISVQLLGAVAYTSPKSAANTVKLLIKLADKSEDLQTKEYTIDTLGKIVSVVPESIMKVIKLLITLLKLLKEDEGKKFGVRRAIKNALVKIATINDQIAFKVTEQLIRLSRTTTNNYDVRYDVRETLIEITKISTDATSKIVDQLINSLKAATTSGTVYDIQEVLTSITKNSIDIAPKALEQLIELLKTTTNYGALWVINPIISGFVKNSINEATKITEQLIELLEMSNNKHMQIAISNTLRDMAKYTIKNAEKTRVRLINLLSTSQDKDVLISVLPTLSSVVKYLANGDEALEQLLVRRLDTVLDKGIQSTTAIAIGNLMQYSNSNQTRKRAIYALIDLLAWDHLVQYKVSETIGKIAGYSSENASIAAKRLVYLLKLSADELHRYHITNALVKVAETSPEIAIKTIKRLLQQIKILSITDMRYSIATNLAEIVESSHKASLEAIKILIQLLRKSAVEYVQSTSNSDYYSELKNIAETSTDAALKISEILAELIIISKDNDILPSTVDRLRMIALSSHNAAIKVTRVFIKLLKTSMTEYLFDASVYSSELIEVANISFDDAVKVVEVLIELIETAKYQDVQSKIIDMIDSVASSFPEAASKAKASIINLLSSEDNDVLKSVINAIPTIGRFLSTKEASKVIKLLIYHLEASDNSDILGISAIALSEIIQYCPYYTEQVVGQLIKRLGSTTDEENNVQPTVLNALCNLSAHISDVVPNIIKSLINLAEASDNDRIKILVANILAILSVNSTMAGIEVGAKAVKFFTEILETSVKPKSLGGTVYLLGELTECYHFNEVTKLIEPLTNLLNIFEHSILLQVISETLVKIANSFPDQSGIAIAPLINLLNRPNNDDDVLKTIVKALGELKSYSSDNAAMAIVPLINLLETSKDGSRPTSFLYKESDKIPVVDLMSDFINGEGPSGTYPATKALEVMMNSSHEAIKQVTKLFLSRLKTSNDDIAKGNAASYVCMATSTSFKATEYVLNTLSKKIKIGLNNEITFVTFVIRETIFNLKSVKELVAVINNNRNSIISAYAMEALTEKLSNKPAITSVVTPQKNEKRGAPLVRTLSFESTSTVADPIDHYVISIEMIPDLLKVIGHDYFEVDIKKIKLNALIVETISKLLSEQIKAGMEGALECVLNNFEEFNSASSESRIILTKICHLVLEESKDGKISDIGLGFLIIAIDSGITALFTRDDEIIIDGATYHLDKAIFREIIRNVLPNENRSITQYNSHQPIFPRVSDSTGGMRFAATYESKIIKLVHNHENLEYGTWQLSLMYLSDHTRASPAEREFLLLEHRDAFGYHLIYQITDQEVFPPLEKHPSEINEEFAKSIFGEMKYTETAKPRYYVISAQINYLYAYEMIAKLKTISAPYDLHTLFEEYSQIEIFATWGENINHPDLKELKAEDLLITNELRTLTCRNDSMKIDLKVVKDTFDGLDIDVLFRVIDKAKLEEKAQREVEQMEEDAFTFYNTLRLQLNATFIACLAIKTKMLASHQRKVWSYISAFGSIMTSTPQVSIGFKLIAIVMSGLETKVQSTKVQYFLASMPSSISEMEVISEQLARAFALKYSSLTFIKGTGVFSWVKDIGNQITDSISNVVNKALESVGEKLNQSAEFAQRFLGVYRRDGPEGEGEAKAIEVAKFITKQLFNNKMNLRDIKDANKKAEQIIQLIEDEQLASNSTQAHLSVVVQTPNTNNNTSSIGISLPVAQIPVLRNKRNCTILYSQIRYDNPILNDLNIANLLQITHSIFGNRGIDELIEVGNNQARYSFFMLLRSMWEDEHAVKMILEYLSNSAITICLEINNDRSGMQLLPIETRNLNNYSKFSLNNLMTLSLLSRENLDMQSSKN